MTLRRVINYYYYYYYYANLARWNISANSGCSLCGSSKQTNKHVLANCPAALERFKIRHNNILLSLANWIQGVKSRGSSLCVDVESEIFQPIGIVFKDSITYRVLSTIRPDIVLFDASTVAVLELTICHETNLLQSRSYKMNKYSNFSHHLNPQFSKHTLKLLKFLW